MNLPFKKNGRQRTLSQKYIKGEIEPDEILMDAKNLPAYDLERLEGKIEKPISKRVFYALGVFFSLIAILFSGKAWILQVRDGEIYQKRSENNSLKKTVVIAERGVILDRNDELIAWNDPNLNGDFSLRKYTESPGFGLLLGYLSYPLKDSSGFYYQPYFVGKDGVEGFFDQELSGKNGLKITETNATGKVESESVLEPPKSGRKVKLSVDSRVESALYGYIKELANRVDFSGGSGVVMDIKTGEIIALTSYPEYNSQILTDGKDTEMIRGYSKSKSQPYLNRPVSGVYTPGSIIKPFVALGALTEGVINPEKEILSTGSISVPNPYDKTKKTVFKDWKAHGYVNMRQAIAVSSNVYFFEVGGGFQNQKGLGINNIEKYLRLFGFGGETGIDMGIEEVGTIPNPKWKEENFEGEIWRIGDTYNTAIGQYGMQITPIQMVRAMAAIANGGVLLKPTILAKDEKEISDQKIERIPIDEKSFQVVREGMRLGAVEGTAKALNISSVKVAAKTGTAELGTTKQRVNSWVTGFFPYESPRYAFIVQMESGPRSNLFGATLVMRELFDWMSIYTPEYLKSPEGT